MPATLILVEGAAEQRLRAIMAKLKREHGATKRADIPVETRMWMQRGMQFVAQVRKLEKALIGLEGSGGAAQKWRTTFHDAAPIPIDFLARVDGLLATHAETINKFLHRRTREQPSWVKRGTDGWELWKAWEGSQYARWLKGANRPEVIQKHIRAITRTGSAGDRYGYQPETSTVYDLDIPAKLYYDVIVPMSRTAPPSTAAAAVWKAFSHHIKRKSPKATKVSGSLYSVPNESLVYFRDVFLPYVRRELEARIDQTKGNERRALRARLKQFAAWTKRYVEGITKTTTGITALARAEAPTAPTTVPASLIRDSVIAPLRRFRVAIEMRVDWLQAVWAFATKATAAKQVGVDAERATGALGLSEPIGKVGTWRLAIRIDPRSVKDADKALAQRLAQDPDLMRREWVVYFMDACKIAFKLMTDKTSRGLGLTAEKIAGPVLLTAETGRGAGGWYRSSDDTLTVNMAKSFIKGQAPEKAYGALPYSNMVWTIVHEVAHRVWYRAISTQGKKFFEAFINSQGETLSVEKRLGFARQAEMSYRNKPRSQSYRLYNNIDYGHSEIMRAGSKLSSGERGLASTWWWYFKDQRLMGYNKQKPHDFFKYLGTTRHTSMLPTDYANVSHIEAWPEILSNMVLATHGWKTSVGSAPATHPFIQAVTRRVLGQATREGEEIEDAEHMLTEADAEAALARAVGGRARLRVLRLGI